MVVSSKCGKLHVWRELFETLNLRGDEKILDVGCGHGLQLITAATQITSGKVIGIDIWRREDQFNNSVTRTMRNAKMKGVADRIRLITADMRQMQFANESFDLIFASQSICNIKSKIGREKAVKEMMRVLKPGGRIIIVDFFYTNEYMHVLSQTRWSSLNRTKWCFKMFPPTRTITGTKSI